MSIEYLDFDGARIALHPSFKGLVVRLVDRTQCVVIWESGYMVFSVPELSTSWMTPQKHEGKPLPLRIRRTGSSDASDTGTAIAVEFPLENRFAQFCRTEQCSQSYFTAASGH